MPAAVEQPDFEESLRVQPAVLSQAAAALEVECAMLRVQEAQVQMQAWLLEQQQDVLIHCQGKKHHPAAEPCGSASSWTRAASISPSSQGSFGTRGPRWVPRGQRLHSSNRHSACPQRWRKSRSLQGKSHHSAPQCFHRRHHHGLQMKILTSWPLLLLLASHSRGPSASSTPLHWHCCACGCRLLLVSMLLVLKNELPKLVSSPHLLRQGWHCLAQEQYCWWQC